MMFFGGSKYSRRGAISRVLILLIVSILLVVLLGYFALRLRPDAHRTTFSQTTVRVYCASGVAQPVEQVINFYNQAYGVNVQIVRTGGSGELAGQIKTEFETGLLGGADLYITADDQLLAKAHHEGLVAERLSLAEQKPVIAVATSSNLTIRNLRDLVQMNDIKYGIASERAAIGKLTRRIAKRDGVLMELESNKATDSENVMTLAQALVAGSLDAAVIWDTTVAQINESNGQSEQPRLKIAAVADPLNEFQSKIAIGVVSATEAPTECLKFARYLTAPETGKAAFEAFGFAFVEGDSWEEVPEIHLYCGSMFTPVLEEAVRQFASREGVNIYPRWEGCGKLVSSMKSIDDADVFPDAYLACDVIFLEEVIDQFESPTTVSKNQIVMAVSKDLAGEIREPADLLDQDLRFGICDPSQSALGELTKKMLTGEPFVGYYDRLEMKAAVTVDAGPTLMSQLLAGGLDVAFVYRSNVMASDRSLEKLRIVEIDKRSKNVVATQPWAVSRTTRNPVLMKRFFEWISRPEIKKRFEKFGFELVDP